MNFSIKIREVLNTFTQSIYASTYFLKINFVYEMTKISFSSTPHTLHLKLNPISSSFCPFLLFPSIPFFLNIFTLNNNNNNNNSSAQPNCYYRCDSFLVPYLSFLSSSFFLYIKNKKSSTQPNYYCCCDGR